MARAKREPTVVSGEHQMRPAFTPEGREQQLTALTVNLVEQRILDGTASAQETVHYLKLASPSYQVKLERERLENELMKAKIDELRQRKNLEAMYEQAVAAMKRYKGEDDPDDYYDEY